MCEWVGGSETNNKRIVMISIGILICRPYYDDLAYILKILRFCQDFVTKKKALKGITKKSRSRNKKVICNIT